jgi:predicted peptidase
MKTSTLMLLLSGCALAFSSAAFGAQTGAPALKEASLVTEVLYWGETVTAVRLEYSDEINGAAVAYVVPYTASDGAFPRYHLFADRPIVNLHVNNTGKKGDVGLFGKYVFLDIGIKNADTTTYHGQVTFNATTRTRPRLDAYTVAQTSPIPTRSGKVIAPTTVSTTREICEGVDDYTTLTYKNEATGHTLYYHLYIPKGYESKRANLKNLPLVAHYPAGDYYYTDWTGKYRGALFTHHDALYWSDEESQAQNPALVVTVGGPSDPNWATVEFSKSEMQQNYVKVIQKIVSEYNIDPSRIYSVSLAGGSPAMWNTIMANPGLFAAQISTSYDPYHAYRSAKSGEDNLAILLKTIPGWFFAGLDDPTGTGILGAADTRLKGERLRDIAAVMNKNGFNIDVAYGSDGELMWNGLLRGDKANKLADDQLARAKARKASRLVTLFMPTTILETPHWSWDATYSNAAVRNWLFQQVNRTPYVPGK